jgi:Fic family protein
VKNAVSVYEKFDRFDPFSVDDLLEAHALMMTNLTRDAGTFRDIGVGIFRGGETLHTAPPPQKVFPLISNLFSYLKESDDVLLVKSCVFHYEFELIHPFCDGNGRIGRLWQRLILSKQHPVFKIICVEELLEQRQAEYFKAICASDRAGSSEAFAEFMLQIILKALENAELPKSKDHRFADRLSRAKNRLDNFKRKKYMRLFPDISSATASRDLARGTKDEILEKIGVRNQTAYKFKRQ